MDAFLEELTLGVWQANCYVLGDRDRGTAVVVDPGQDAAAGVCDILARNDVRCEAILLTHGHLDHLWSVPGLSRRFDAPAFLHPEDGWLWDNPAQGFGPLAVDSLEQQFGLRWDTADVELEKLGDGDRIVAGGLAFEVRHTPGHTPGSCVFLLRSVDGHGIVGADVLVSGDLIFAGSVGRTDLPRGSSRDLRASIREAVLSLEDGTVIVPGHGPHSTVGRERQANPFLR